jgi:Predicted transcriptional regulator, contains C-terminal CBS domains
MKAKDLMIPIQKCLKPDNTLKEAVNLLQVVRHNEEWQGVKGLPVLDPAGKIVGILSMRDILKAVHPFYLSMMDLGDFTWDSMVKSLAQEAACKKVKDHMTSEVVTVRENEPLMECIDLMIKKNIKLLPVMDDRGQVEGMICEQDVFCAITGAMLDTDSCVETGGKR